MWTPENIQILKTMWAQKYTAAEIGAVLGCTRNAVLGKKHRLELQDRRIKLDGVMKPTCVKINQKSVPFPVEVPKGKPLSALKAGECRWPHGDPKEEGFGFCAKTTERVYCEEHTIAASRIPTKAEKALLRRIRA